MLFFPSSWNPGVGKGKSWEGNKGILRWTARDEEGEAGDSAGVENATEAISHHSRLRNGQGHKAENFEGCSMVQGLNLALNLV